MPPTTAQRVAERHLQAGRPKDTQGHPIYLREDYILQHKRFGHYYAGGSWHSYQTTNNPDQAIIVHGAVLLDSSWDWASSWDAIHEPN